MRMTGGNANELHSHCTHVILTTAVFHLARYYQERLLDKDMGIERNGKSKDSHILGYISTPI